MQEASLDPDGDPLGGAVGGVSTDDGHAVDPTDQEAAAKSADPDTCEPFKRDNRGEGTLTGGCGGDGRLMQILGGYRENRLTMKAFAEGVRKTVKHLGRCVDKWYIPTLIISAGGGMGKTAFLNHVFRSNDVSQPVSRSDFVVGAINQEIDSALADPFLEPHKRPSVRVDACVVRIATFGDLVSGIADNAVLDTVMRIERETAGRLLGNGPVPRPTDLSPPRTFGDAVDILRREAAASLDDAGRLRFERCDGRNIAVVICIDELLSVADPNVLGRLLDSLAPFQQLQLAQGFPMVVLVTSMNYMPVHELFCIGSRRPLYSVPLYPLNVVATCMEVVRNSSACYQALLPCKPVDTIAVDLRANLDRVYRVSLQLCSGHPRALETVLDSLLTKSSADTSIAMPLATIADIDELREYWEIFCECVQRGYALRYRGDVDNMRRTLHRLHSQHFICVVAEPNSGLYAVTCVMAYFVTAQWPRDSTAGLPSLSVVMKATIALMDARTDVSVGASWEAGMAAVLCIVALAKTYKVRNVCQMMAPRFIDLLPACCCEYVTPPSTTQCSLDVTALRDHPAIVCVDRIDCTGGERSGVFCMVKNNLTHPAAIEGCSTTLLKGGGHVVLLRQKLKNVTPVVVKNAVEAIVKAADEAGMPPARLIVIFVTEESRGFRAGLETYRQQLAQTVIVDDAAVATLLKHFGISALLEEPWGPLKYPGGGEYASSSCLHSIW